MRHDYDAMRNVHVRAFTLHDAERLIEDLNDRLLNLRDSVSLLMKGLVPLALAYAVLAAVFIWGEVSA